MRLRTSLLALALVLTPTVAAAQTTDADRVTARALAQQGQDALDRRDFTTAADRFGRAADLVHAPTLTLGLARAQIGLGKWLAAHETYNRLVREGVPEGAPPAFTKAVAEGRAELEALEPRIPNVIVNVTGAPSPRVTLDGATLPNAVLGVGRAVDPGRHTIRAEADGFAAAEAVVTVAERRTETVTLTLDHRQAAPSPAGPAGAPPPETSPSPSPSTATTPPPDGGQGSSVRKTLGFAGIGVGGAGLLMGVVTGVLAIGKHSTLASECHAGVCFGHQSDLDSFHLMSNLADAGLVAGGVLAAAGVVLVVTAPKPGASGSAWVAPLVGPGFAGVQGRF